MFEVISVMGIDDISSNLKFGILMASSKTSTSKPRIPVNNEKDDVTVSSICGIQKPGITIGKSSLFCPINIPVEYENKLIYK